MAGQGAEAARLVRLTFADGATVEDTADGGVVLFLASPGVSFPARVQILGTEGNVLAEVTPGHPQTRAGGPDAYGGGLRFRLSTDTPARDA
jgi:hypothetical protein